MFNRTMLSLSTFLLILPILNYCSQTDHYKNFATILLKNYLQIDDKSLSNQEAFNEKTYLTKILQLNRNEIITKFNNKNTFYINPKSTDSKPTTTYESSEFINFKKCMEKIQESGYIICGSWEKNQKTTFNNKSNIQKFLLQLGINALSAAEEMTKSAELKNSISDDAPLITNSLKKMSLLMEALYLASTSEEDIKENNALAKKLSPLYHPDKNPNQPEEEQEFCQNINALLLNNQTNKHLTNLINDTYEKTIDRIKKPSIAKTISDLTTNLMLCPAAEVIGYKTMANLLPNKPMENYYYQMCIQEAKKGALLIETELSKFPNKR